MGQQEIRYAVSVICGESRPEETKRYTDEDLPMHLQRIVDCMNMFGAYWIEALNSYEGIKRVYTRFDTRGPVVGQWHVAGDTIIVKNDWSKYATQATKDEYECYNCHDQGCYQCMDKWQLNQ